MIRRLIARLLWPAKDTPTVVLRSTDIPRVAAILIDHPVLMCDGTPGAFLTSEECGRLAIALNHAVAQMEGGDESVPPQR